MKETLTILGKRIARLRTRRGLTQEKLAEMLHYSTNHISKLESARTNPSFELLFAISKALDVELKEIFNFDEFYHEKILNGNLNNFSKLPTLKKFSLRIKYFARLTIDV